MSNEVSITTNYHWHDFLYGYGLSKEELEEFDYIDPEELAYRQFIRYQGVLYDTHEFEPTARTGWLLEDLKKWDAYLSDAPFSGILLRYSADFEQYQVATYFS